MAGGRPSDYSEELGAAICSRLAYGDPLTKICAEGSMPCESTVYLWLLKHPEFSEMYARAREDQADTLADQMLVIADDTSGDVNRDRLRVDTRKWIATKLKPRKYGDKTTNELTGPGGKALELSVNLHLVRPDAA